MELSDQQASKWLDVDFGPAAKKHGRMMGCLPRVEAPGTAGLPLYGDVRPIIPRSQWKELIRERMAKGWLQRKLIKFCHDQNGEPSCTSNATVLQHTIKQAEQYGIANAVVLSPISVYRFVGSPRSGSTLTGNMRRMLATGALPLDTPENRAKFSHVHPHNGYSKPLPTGYESTANLFRNAEYADIDNFDELVSALLCGHSALYARNGHCILAVGLSYTSSGALVLEYMNSWALSFGDPCNEVVLGGIGYDSERTASNAAGGSIVLLNVQSPYAQAI